LSIFLCFSSRKRTGTSRQAIRTDAETAALLAFFDSVQAKRGFVTEDLREKIMADKAQLTVPLSKMIAELSEKHEMPKKKLAELFGDFIDLTVKNLKKGNKVRITGLGIMQVRNRPARMGRNPATGEAIKIKASRKVAFRVAKEVKEAI
jgi:DNA-binding protein HU-beta